MSVCTGAQQSCLRQGLHLRCCLSWLRRWLLTGALSGRWMLTGALSGKWSWWDMPVQSIMMGWQCIPALFGANLHHLAEVGGQLDGIACRGLLQSHS